MGPELMNCCKPEQMGTKEYGKMLPIIQLLEDGRVPAKEAITWRIEGQKRRITRKEYQRLLHKFEMEGFMAQEGLWNLVREKKRCFRIWESYLWKRVTSLENTRLCMKKIS